jgi:hypothetical protein
MYGTHIGRHPACHKVPQTCHTAQMKHHRHALHTKECPHQTLTEGSQTSQAEERLSHAKHVTCGGGTPEGAHLVAQVLLHQAPAARLHAGLDVALQTGQALAHPLLVVIQRQLVHVLVGEAQPLVLLVVPGLVQAALQVCAHITQLPHVSLAVLHLCAPRTVYYICSTPHDQQLTHWMAYICSTSDEYRLPTPHKHQLTHSLYCVCGTPHKAYCTCSTPNMLSRRSTSVAPRQMPPDSPGVLPLWYMTVCAGLMPPHQHDGGWRCYTVYAATTGPGGA